MTRREYLLESREEYERRLDREFAACRDFGRQVAQRFEEQIVEVLRKKATMIHTNHLARLVARVEDIAECLLGRAKLNTSLLPTDVQIVEIHEARDFAGDVMHLVLESESFAAVADGEQIPLLYHSIAQFESLR